ncbi:MAG: aromatic amino acid lyase [Chloroflexota bacterium]
METRRARVYRNGVAIQVKGIRSDFSTPITIRQADDVSLELFEEIAWGGRRLTLHSQLLEHLGASHSAMEHLLENGDPVYGINTGMGYLSTVRLTDAEQALHQANLFVGRAVGGAPYLEWGEARAVLLARVLSFLSGHAAVSPALCTFIVDRLNDDFVPAIPRTGIGCAGEVIPLAHAFGTFLGLGEVLSVNESLTSAREALHTRNVMPYRPAAKEGIALLAGAPGTLALAIARHRSASLCLQQVTMCWACAIDAIDAPRSPYHPAIAEFSRDPILSRVLKNLTVFIGDTQHEQYVTQAPISFRVVPQVLTHVHRTLDRLKEDIDRALPATTDSPAVYKERFLSTGSFHAIGLAAQMDALCVALVHAGEIANAQIHRLLDHRFSGLPDQLSAHPGPHAGLVAVHKRAVAAVHEMRMMASPASLGLMDTSLGQEDALTFAFESAEKLRKVEYLLRDVIACELLVCRQAWALRSGLVSPGLREFAKELGAVIEPVPEDRRLGPEINTLQALLVSGQLC